ncbi:beta-galactosidase 8-like [Ixodes scapularis]|nr:beta-galactosidase 8-like [Ixodes scapularis]
MEAVPVTKNRDVSYILQLLLDAVGQGDVPGFFHGTFQLPQGEPADTFLDPRGWGKGIAFVNGINLGRYWATVGPQITLYVPAPFLLAYPEDNRLVLLELEMVPRDSRVRLVDTPKLDADF